MPVFAVVEGGVVVNTVMAEAPLEQSWVEAPSGCGIGWYYHEGQFIAPSVPGPTPVTKEQQELARQVAYTQEADPLFFKWQADEATKEDWLAKRQEIRNRYPY